MAFPTDQGNTDARVQNLLSELFFPLLQFHPYFMPRILSCLMEHLYTEKMVEDCEHRLLELQYFISRDWK